MKLHKWIPGLDKVATPSALLKVEAVAYAVLYVAGALGVGLTSAAIYAISYALIIGATYAYGTWQASSAKRASRDAFNSSLTDRLVMTATTSAPRSRLYGRVRNVDGVLFKATHGTAQKFYTFVVAVAGHEIDAFEAFYFNDVLLPLDGSGYLTGSPFSIASLVSVTEDAGSTAAAGSFTLAHAPLDLASTAVISSNGMSGEAAASQNVAFTIAGSVVSWTGNTAGFAVSITYQWTKITPKARVRGYRGQAGQDLSGDLIALGISGITSAHKFAGIACMIVTLEYDVDAFPQGVPQMTAVVRGAKVFDPRTGVTAWSENPALIARDWALYAQGGGATAADLHAASFITAANDCDVTHAFVGTSNTVTRPSYTCGIVANTQGDPTEVLQEIVTAMAGKYAWGGGLLMVKAGAYHAPVATIDESWLADGSIDIQAGVSRVDLVNVYRPSIADIDVAFVVRPTAQVRAAAYIAADGGVELPREVTFLGITDTDHAQHVAGVLMRDARSGLLLKLPCNFRAYPLELFDTVSVNLARFGFVAKTFELIDREVSTATGVALTLKETAAAIFDPATQFLDSDDTPNTNLPSPWTVVTPNTLVVTSGTAALTDGSILTRVRVQWTVADYIGVSQAGSFEVQAIKVSDLLAGKDWITFTVDGSARELVIPGLQDSIAYVFRVRAVTAIGVRSAWSPQVVHVVATVLPIDWTNLVGKPLLFRVLATGYGVSTAPSGFVGLSNGDTGAALVGATVRSYTLARIRRSDGVVTFSQTYDVNGSGAVTAGRNAATLAADLNATGTDSIVVVMTADEPSFNRLTGGLDAAMYRCGASRSVFGSPQFRSRAAYCLIAIAGCGEGNGFESYHGAVDLDPNAWVDVAFMLKGGNLIITGSGASPGTLADYGYTGTLDATTDLVLVARNSCVVAGNYASKIGGAMAWDSDVYSRDSFTGGAFMSFRPAQTNAYIMLGLNSDPQTDQAYTSLDFCWYPRADGFLDLYENGSSAAQIGGVGTYLATDVLSIVYDGNSVSYQKNGQVRRTVVVGPGLNLFLDSSFYTPGAAASNLRFGPQSAVSGIGTGQIASGAATFLTQDAHDFASAGFGGTSVLRTVVVTPPVACLIEFTATATANKLDNDGGNYLLWRVTPAGGSVLTLGGSSTVGNTNYQQAVAANSFVAVAGVALTFELVSRASVGSINVRDTAMRITEIRR